MAQNSLTSTDKEIIIDLRVEGAKEALAAVANATKEIDQLKEAQKELKKEYKDGAITEKEYYDGLVKIKTQLNDQKNTLRANQKVLDEQVKAYKKQEDSINSMRAKLKLLRASYEDMSKAERDSAKGTELLNKIKSLTSEIKTLEQDQGDFRRNVGNYMSIWDAEADKIQSFGSTLASVFGSNSIFGKAATVVQGFGRAMSTIGKEVQDANNQITNSAKTTASETTKSFTQVGQSIQNVGTEAQDNTKVVQGFGKALYDTAEPSKEAATAMNDAAKAASDLNTGTQSLESGAANVAQSTAEMASSTSKLSSAFGMAGQAVKAFAKQLLSLLANPIVAAFAAIVVVVMKLVDAFKKNDTAMTELQKAMSAFQPILDAINWLFEKLVGTVTKVITVLGNAAKAIGGFFGGDAYKQSQQRAEALVSDLDALEDKEREYTLAHADNEAEIAKLREQASDAENYTTEQRKQFLQQAIDIERQDLEARHEIAAEKVRLAEQEALQQRGYLEMTAEAWANLTDEEKNNITQLRAALRATDKEMSDFERKMNKQLNSLTKSATSTRNAAASARKERIKNEQEAFQELEAMYISTIKDMYAKEEAQLRASTKKQIEQIQLKLNTEKNLTTKAKEALNKQIILLEAKLQTDLYDLREKYQKDRLKKELDEQKAWYETLLNGVRGEAKETVQVELIKINTTMAEKALTESLDNMRKTVQEAERDVEELDYNELAAKYSAVWDFYGINLSDNISNMRAMIDMFNSELVQKEAVVSNTIQEIHKQEELNIVKIKKEGELKREEIAQQYAETMAQIADTKELENFYYNEVAKTQILQEQAQRRVDIAQENLDRLTNYTEQEKQALYDTDEEYQLAVAEATLQVTEAEVALADAVRNTTAAIQAQKDKSVETFKSIASSVSNVIGSVQSIFETLAESDEKYKKYSTALAMMNILVSTAISIANAIQGATAAAAATGPGAPIATPVFIAEMIAIVAGAIASATATLKKAQSSAPAKPKFSTGGPVDKSHTGGMVGTKTTTRTDDTIDAKLSLGEYVIRSSVVKALGVDFFDRLNGKRTKKKELPLRFASGGTVPSVTTIQMAQSQIDYSQMREMFTEVVQEIQPVVSVKEINSVQNRVNVKEQTASYN